MEAFVARQERGITGLNDCNAAVAANRGCHLTGTPIDFQSTVVQDWPLNSARSIQSPGG